eukprot:RCo004293
MDPGIVVVVIPSEGQAPLLPSGTSAISTVPMAERLTPHQRKTLVAILISVVLYNYCAATPDTIFPLQTHEMGISISTVGAIVAAHPIVVVLSAPICGLLCTRVGYFPVLCGGIIVLILGMLFFGAVPWLTKDATQAIWLFLGARILYATGDAFLDTCSVTGLAQTFKSTLGTRMGQFETCLGIGSAVGAPVGAKLFSLAGFFLPFAVATIVVVLVLASLISAQQASCWMESNPEESTEATEADTEAVSRNLSLNSCRPLIALDVLFPVLGMMLATMGCGWTSPFLPLYYRQTFGITVTTVGIVYSVGSLGYAALSTFTGHLSDRYGPHLMVCMGTFLGSFSYVLLGCHSPAASCTGSVCYSLSTSLMIPPGFAAVLRSVSERSSSGVGLASGIMNSMCSCGEIAGPLLGAFLAEKIGSVLAIRCYAFVLFAFGVLYTVAFLCRMR